MKVKNLLFPVDYFQWLLRFFRILGLYSPNRHERKIIYNFFTALHGIVTMFSVILELLNVVLHSETFERKMLNIGVLTMHFGAVMRVLNWFWTRREFEDVIGIIQRCTFEFRVFAYDGYARTKSKSTSATLDLFKASALRRTNLICCSCYLLVSSYVFWNLFVTYILNYSKYTYESFNPVLNKTSVFRELPYPMWFPFDVSVSDGYHRLAFFYQPYAYFSIMTSFWSVDWLVLSCIIQLQGQMKVISFAMKNLDKNISNSIGTEKTVLIKKVRLVKCIQELNEIFRAAGMIEELCNVPMLVQNTSGTFIICSLLYVTLTLTTFSDLAYIATVTGIVLIEPLILSCICQNFATEVFNVLEKIYELNWIDYPPNLRKNLVFTMTRLQKPPMFTLGKWKVIDLSFYLQLLKWTYSFYALLSSHNKRAK